MGKIKEKLFKAAAEFLIESTIPMGPINGDSRTNNKKRD